MAEQGWAHSASFDWDKVSEDPPEQAAPGIYRAKIIEAAPQESKNGTPMVQLTLQLTEGLGGASLVDSNGREVSSKLRFESIPITQEAAFRVKQLCSSAKIPPPESQAYGTILKWAQDSVLDASVIVKVRHRTATQGASAGRTFAQVESYLTEDKAMLAINQQGTAAAGSAPKRVRPKRA